MVQEGGCDGSIVSITPRVSHHFFDLHSHDVRLRSAVETPSIFHSPLECSNPFGSSFFTVLSPSSSFLFASFSLFKTSPDLILNVYIQPRNDVLFPRFPYREYQSNSLLFLPWELVCPRLPHLSDWRRYIFLTVLRLLALLSRICNFS